jgi:hypothetical protein
MADPEEVESFGVGGVGDLALDAAFFAGAEEGDEDADAGRPEAVKEPVGEVVGEEVGVEGDPSAACSHDGFSLLPGCSFCGVGKGAGRGLGSAPLGVLPCCFFLLLL